MFATQDLRVKAVWSIKALLAIALTLGTTATASLALPTEYLCESDDPGGNFEITRQGGFGTYSTDQGNGQIGFHYLTCDGNQCAFQMEIGGGALVATTHQTFLDDFKRVFMTTSVFDTRSGTIESVDAHSFAIKCVVIQ